MATRRERWRFIRAAITMCIEIGLLVEDAFVGASLGQWMCGDGNRLGTVS